MNYALVSIDWNPEQTKLWLKCIEKYSPKAKVILFPEVNRIGCWSCAKLTCFEDHPGYEDVDYIIYTDTDVLILHELEELLPLPGDAVIGLSPLKDFHGCQGIASKIHSKVFETRKTKKKIDSPMRTREVDNLRLRWLKDTFGDNIAGRYKHYSSGMIIMRPENAPMIESTWHVLTKYIKEQGFLENMRWLEEVSLSLLVRGLTGTAWDIPSSVHNNLLSPRTDLDVIPWVLHYHNLRRLTNRKYERILKKCQSTP